MDEKKSKTNSNYNKFSQNTKTKQLDDSSEEEEESDSSIEDESESEDKNALPNIDAHKIPQQGDLSSEEKSGTQNQLDESIENNEPERLIEDKPSEFQIASIWNKHYSFLDSNIENKISSIKINQNKSPIKKNIKLPKSPSSFTDSLISGYSQIKSYFSNLILSHPKSEEEYNKGLLELVNILENLNEILNFILSMQRFKKTSVKANYNRNLDEKVLEKHKVNEQKVYEIYKNQYTQIEKRYETISDKNYLMDLENQIDTLNLKMKQENDKNKKLKKDFFSLQNEGKKLNLSNIDQELQNKVKKLQDDYDRINFELNEVLKKTDKNIQTYTLGEEIQNKLEQKQRELLNQIKTISSFSAFEDLGKKVKNEKKKEKEIEKLQKQYLILQRAKKIKIEHYRKEIQKFEKKFTELEKDKTDLENKLNDGLEQYSEEKGKNNLIAIKSNILIQSNVNSSTKNVLGTLNKGKKPKKKPYDNIKNIFASFGNNIGSNNSKRNNKSENSVDIKNSNDLVSNEDLTLRNLSNNEPKDSKLNPSSVSQSLDMSKNHEQKPSVAQSAVISKASVLKGLEKIEKENHQNSMLENNLNNSIVIKKMNLKPNFSFPSGGLNKLNELKNKDKELNQDKDGIDEDIQIEEDPNPNNNLEEGNKEDKVFLTGNNKEFSKKEGSSRYPDDDETNKIEREELNNSGIVNHMDGDYTKLLNQDDKEESAIDGVENEGVNLDDIDDA